MRYLKEVVSFLIALLLTLCLIMAAHAAEPDSARTASVTIHKYLMEDGKSLALEGDGREITNPGSQYVYQNDGKTTLKDLKGLNGIQFTLTRVKDGATSASNATTYTGSGAYKRSVTTARVNGQDGIAVFDNLPHGLYLVEETKSGDYKADMEKFLLQVPMPDPTGKEAYLYDIHVYPKNTGDGGRSKDFTKEVKKRTGNEVIWEFAWVIPDKIETGKTWILTDELDSRLTYKGVTVSYQDRSGASKTLATTYYEVKYDKGDRTLTVSINGGDGFAQLAKALLPESGKKTPTLYVQVTTTINSNATGTIKNSGEITYEDEDGKETQKPKKDPSVDVEDGEGGLCIYKYDDETNKPLAGAEFKLYASRSDAADGKNAVSMKAYVTGPDGYLLIEGLEYSGKSTSYWLVETKAPVVNGKEYNLLTGPLEVQVGPSSHLKSNRVMVANNTGLMVRDPSGGPGGTGAKVPDSGGVGNLPYTLLGMALIGLGAAAFSLLQRRNK